MIEVLIKLTAARFSIKKVNRAPAPMSAALLRTRLSPSSAPTLLSRRSCSYFRPGHCEKIMKVNIEAAILSILLSFSFVSFRSPRTARSATSVALASLSAPRPRPTSRCCSRKAVAQLRALPQQHSEIVALLRD